MSNKIYVNDIGTEIILDTGVDITSATIHNIKVTKPTTTVPITWNATIFETTKLRYIVQENDLDLVGQYKLMAEIALPDWSGHGETATMEVHNLWT